MNNLTIMGRLVADPEVRQTKGDKPISVASYTVAVDKPFSKDGQREANFFRCRAWGKQAEFADKYMKKGMKMAIVGSVENDNYTDKNNITHYGFVVNVNSQEFCESKSSSNNDEAAATPDENGFMNVPDGVDMELPFN